MESNTKVSIIVPIYNVEKYIERCLESLINQTLKEIEIILIDDKTTDDSMKICEKYAKIDDRIKIYKNPTNIGLGLSRNKGIECAKGEFVAFVDSDDFVDKKFYENLYKKAKKENADVCFSKAIKYEKNSTNKIEITNSKEAIETRKAFYNMLDINKKNKYFFRISVCYGIYKTKILREKNIKFMYEREYLSEDIIFNFDFLANGKIATFCEDVYYYYCYNDISITHRYDGMRFVKAKKLYEKLIKQAIKYREIKTIKKHIANFFIGNIRWTIKDGIYSGKLKKEDINKIISDKLVRHALKNKSRETFTRSIFDFLIRTKQINLLIACCKIHRGIDKR